jgi:uncharacterized protein (DUF2141 family)
MKVQYILVLILALTQLIAANAAEVRGVVKLQSGETIQIGTIWIQKFAPHPKYPGEAHIVAIDSSDKEGNFIFQLEPGSYAVNLIGDRCSWFAAKVPLRIAKKEKVVTVLLTAREEICSGVRPERF